ncbi:3-oxoacyl-(acyl-carrier-protein) reductase FabG [Mesorhizobium plurifarium]|uniref:3-oxoacyl-(Acyl-carrier-protein) reductase FabG n=1 Tax=Mesorhizobium plurifarium TaxID=69974 RepID=A0A090F137_MESPL|nr:3-oxoacyl-(acyl-carrier-protein) reductase FabG [Mesorhizobium plurifarium]
MEMMWLKGKVAIVTGGAMGIGAAISEMLAELGSAVAIADINLDAAKSTASRLSKKVGGRVEPFKLDVTSWDSAFAMEKAVAGSLGPIDILVNNAGASKRVPFLEMDEAEWDRILDINLKSQFIVTRAVLPGMVERGKGRVINLGSVTSKKGYAPFSHYCTSKFGVMGLTQSLAAEFATTGITFNTVCPGILETPLHEGIAQEIADAAGVSLAEAKRNFFANVPMGHPQEPRDVAGMVAFLASDLGRNMTGGTYHVDGGMVMD